MSVLRNNARVSLLARLGRAPKNKALQAKVRPAEPRSARAIYLKWVRAFFVLWSHVVTEKLDLRHDGMRTDAPRKLDFQLFHAGEPGNRYFGSLESAQKAADRLNALGGPGHKFTTAGRRLGAEEAVSAASPLTRLDWETLVDQSGARAMLDRVSSRVGSQVTTYYGNIFRQPPPKIPREAAIVEDFRKTNIDLIKGMGEKHVADLNGILTEATARGVRHEETAALIQEQLGIGQKKAALIARDQTLKYNASVHTAQATASGIERYDWSTSHDGDVRPMHAELDGKRFRYDDPPVTNLDGDRNNPGEDYNCRCAAIPVIDLFEGIDDTEA